MWDLSVYFSPSAPRTGLKRCLIVIIKRFLVHLDKLLSLDFSTDNLKVSMEIDQGIFLVQYKPFQSSLVQWARVFAVTLAAFPGVNNSNIVSDNLSVSRPAHYPTSLCSSEYGSRYSGCQSPGHKCSKSQGASSQFKLNHSLENHSLYSKQHPAD